MPLYHIYVGTKYQGPQRGEDDRHAIILFAQKMDRSPLIFNAKPSAMVQDLKKPQRESDAGQGGRDGC